MSDSTSVNAAVRASLPVRAGQYGRVQAERLVKRLVWSRRLQAMVDALPEGLQEAGTWVVDPDPTEWERDLAERVERRRADIAQATGTISSYHSPLPGTFQRAEDGHAVPGPLLPHRAGAHAKTGSKPAKGILLNRIAVGLGAQRILELGTNTGLSGSYLAASPACRTLVTIEGSPELAEVARQTLAQFTTGADVRAALFDDALDDLDGAKAFDLAFIDGQHEGAATEHYYRRVLPLMAQDGGVVIFDDITWSQDMRQAWLRIVDSGAFTLTVDFGRVGLGVLGPHRPSGHVDFPKYLGRGHVQQRIGDSR
jgi:predicted O-methyltransferase YrrM